VVFGKNDSDMQQNRNSLFSADNWLDMGNEGTLL